MALTKAKVQQQIANLVRQPDFVHYLDQGGEHRPSILVDVDKGKVTENEFHCGELARLAGCHKF